jgi:RsiW-degrading membrane proteinase PrsW (M82 family)
VSTLPVPPRPDIRGPRWGHTTSLFQVRTFAFWVFAALLAGAGMISIQLQGRFADIALAGWLLSWGLLLLYAVPVFALIYVLDLYEREPVSLILGALLWGAFVAPIASGIANDGWGLVIAKVGGAEFAGEWSAALTAPWIEEIMKAAGVMFLVLIARDEFDDVLDGFVYGAMVGLGFTVVEDVFYFMSVFGGQPSGVLVGFFLRVVASGLYGHLLYSGLTGMGIAFFVTRRGETSFARRVGAAAALFAAAMFAHFLWNSPLLDLFPAQPWTGFDWLLIPLATAVKGVPVLAGVYLAVSMARRREARWLVAALANEVGRGGLLPEELQTLASPRAKRRAVKEMRARAGPGAARLLKRLHRQQINLAMVRTRVEGDDDPDLVRQREYCRSLRAALLAMPGAAPALTAPAS